MSAAACSSLGLDWAGRVVQIEYQWLNTQLPASPLMVFLHEGLGSVAMWRDFPQRACDALGWRGLVYSRPGYGQSSPREANEHWGPDFMHRQADEVLPALLNKLGVHAPVWLFGHSDGGSIALLAAAHQRLAVAGVVALAPHIMVEPISLRSIEAACHAYRQGDWAARLARYHADTDSAFWGWAHAWLHPAFADWSIADELAAMGCPVLAVQGVDDEYGSLAQIEGIAKRVPLCECVALDDCGHSPQRDQPARVLQALLDFVHRHHRH